SQFCDGVRYGERGRGRKRTPRRRWGWLCERDHCRDRRGQRDRARFRRWRSGRLLWVRLLRGCPRRQCDRVHNCDRGWLRQRFEHCDWRRGGGSALGAASSGTGGLGGSATGSATALGGTGDANASSTAQGGAGGSLGLGRGGNGGNATSTATATGGSSATALSNATAGVGGSGLTANGAAGTANATSSATAAGPGQATAQAVVSGASG